MKIRVNIVVETNHWVYFISQIRRMTGPSEEDLRRESERA
jgi:hypothetical protein